MGKDTVAGILTKHFGFQKVSFARSLKLMMSDVFPHLTSDQLHGDAKEQSDAKLGNQTPRDVMIRLATSVRQRLGKRAFVDPVVTKIKSATPSTGFVVSDLRFMEEYRALKSIRGSIFVRVVRPGVREHECENELADKSLWDYTIINNGTKNQLERAVTRLLTDVALTGSRCRQTPARSTLLAS